MCGRFTLYSPLDEIMMRFNIEYGDISYTSRYNIAPSQKVLAVVNDGKRNRMGYLRWGFVPPWANDPKIGNQMINARAETLAEKPSFRQAYRKKRCLIIADGFYEWNGKVPMYIQLKNRQPFAFAGLWERWTGADGEEITSCIIVTTKANELLVSIHPRMPVILDQEQEKIWLDRNIADPNILDQLLQPYPAEKMMAYPVSTLVNSPKNNNESLIKPV